jgi:hypothetical protein
MCCRQRSDIAITPTLPPPPEQLRCYALPFFVWKWVRGGGVSSACFACAAPLALVRIGGVFGVVRWRGNWWQCWGIGGGLLALGRRRLHVSSDFAAWHWGGHVGGVVLMGRWRWRIGWAGALSRRWCQRAGVEGGGTCQSTSGGRWKGGVGSNHCIELGGRILTWRNQFLLVTQPKQD